MGPPAAGRTLSGERDGRLTVEREHAVGAPGGPGVDDPATVASRHDLEPRSRGGNAGACSAWNEDHRRQVASAERHRR